MSRYDDRIGRIERRKRRGRPLILHVLPGETHEGVIAAYVRKRGPISKRDRVLTIKHTFKSAI